MARITVVKDYPAILETMCDIIDALEGHEVVGFDGDETSLEQLIESRPQLLILDLRMPPDEMDGWQMLALARSTPQLCNVPVIVCSADVIALRNRSTDLAQFGNVYSLEIPFTVELAEAVIHQALDGAGSSDRRAPSTAH